MKRVYLMFAAMFFVGCAQDSAGSRGNGGAAGNTDIAGRGGNAVSAGVASGGGGDQGTLGGGGAAAIGGAGGSAGSAGGSGGAGGSAGSGGTGGAPGGSGGGGGSGVERQTVFATWCPSSNTEPGYYKGNLGFNLNDISSVSCAGPASGRDGGLRVVVAPGQKLSVNYTSEGDGVLYILDSCPVVGSCLAAADSTTTGGQERVEWTNSGGVENPVYVILDNEDLETSGSFTVDILLD